MKSNFILKMAFRNIGRNKRRTALSAAAITFAVMFVLFGNSYIGGLSKDMSKTMFMFQTAHIKIMNKDYLKEAKMMPLDLNIYGFERNYREVVDMVKKVEDVEYVVPRTKFGAMLNLQGKMKNVMGFAMDAQAEAPVNPLAQKIVKGRMFSEYSPGVHEIVMGEPLAQELGKDVGDKITMMTKTAEEGLGHMTFTIVGLSSYGIAQYDKMYFFVPLSAAARFLKMPDEVLELAIYVKNPKNSIRTAKEINDVLKTRSGHPYEVLAWEQQESGTFYRWIGLAEKVYSIIYVIFLALASLVIINTTMMVIYERMKEIGTIAALGMRGADIVKLFFYEAVIISTIGSFFGTVLGGVLSYIISVKGINFAKLTGGAMSEGGLPNIIYGTLNIQMFIFAFLFGVLVASACSFIPSARAARIEPVEALREVF